MPMSYREVVGPRLFGGPPFRWRMGLRGCAPDAWLQVDDEFDADLSRKAELLAADPVACVGALEGATAACDELLEAIRHALRAHGRAPSRAGSSAIDTAGRSVQEDLCLLQRDRHTWRLTAGSVCFPTRWALRDKLGLGIDAIHAPVPDYDTTLAPRMMRVLDRLRPDRLVARSNWSLVDDGSRHLPAERPQAPARLPSDPGRSLFVRVERQTLRRLPGSDAVVFTIRIHRWRLGDVVDEVRGDGLPEILAAMPGAVARYKNLDGIGPGVRQWLLEPPGSAGASVPR